MKHISEALDDLMAAIAASAAENAVPGDTSIRHASAHAEMADDITALFRNLEIVACSVAHISAAIVASDLDTSAERLKVLQQITQCMTELGAALQNEGERAGQGHIFVPLRRNDPKAETGNESSAETS